MSSGSTVDAEEEKKVKGIIDALKSEGLFDQFRKECLADVDTKPAYQNLRQRVEGYVSRFLSRQQWSPSLNKNQLRDNLRKQITASGMLANGVERVIEQVINPKILQLIKPKIDEVVCSRMGIDPKERQATLEAKKQKQKENLQSLMSVNISQAEQNQTSTPGSFQEQPSAPTFSSPYSQAMWTQQMPPQVAFGGMMPNYPMVPSFGGFPFGMPPQMFPYWNNYMYPQPMPGIPFPPPMSSAAETTTTASSSAQFEMSPIPPIPSTPTKTTTTTVDTPTPPKSSLPPLPPTPPPPGTEDEPVVIPKEDNADEIELPKVLDDIPLPPITMPTQSEIKRGLTSKDLIGDSEDSQQNYGMSGDDDDESRDTKRPYKFAWDEDVDNKSDITISSVHTSDLSSFSDVESENASVNELFESDKSDDEEKIEESLDLDDMQAPEMSPLSAIGDGETDVIEDNVEEIETLDIPPTTSTDIEPESPVEESVQKTEPVTQTAMVTSPIKPKKVLPAQTSVEPGSETSSPNKPRKLLSLQYNYSDSEDEETRQDKKSRLAKEKEERYLKRAQRRAELEAKRKEREEERARLREERKKSQEQKPDESLEKALTDSSDKVDRTDSLEESVSDKVPSSPEKKKRKTKAELKMELTKQKVMEKKLALRRQRTRNRRYTSDEFTSIFTEKKQPFSSQSYSEVVIEEPAIEETVVTDNIEYIVDDSQTGYQSQEVCETMEGEVILEDGRQLKVEVFMEDMPSPPTPTQDENDTEITPIQTSDVHIDLTSQDIQRSTSPLSDVSDESLTEVTKISKSKRQSSESTKGEKEHKKSQRYDTSDLYKPRPTISGRRRRNSSSPGAAVETTESKSKKKYKRSSSRKSENSRSSSRSRSRSRSVESDCQPSPISSSSLTSVHSRQSSYSGSGSSSSSEEKSRSRSRSSSGSSVDEFGRRKRRKGKMPIDMIDFGEAERMIEKNLYRVSFGEAERRAASRRFKGRGRGGITRGVWQRQNSWQFPEGAGEPAPWSPEGSPSKRFYFPDDAPSPSPPSPMREMSPGIVRRARATPSPPMWDARSESPPYYPGTRARRSSSQIEDSPPRRPQYNVGRRPQSPPPEYLRRSLSPSEHIITHEQMSPEQWGHRSPSPPYHLDRMTPSPPPYISRGQRSPSPGRSYRGARSPSPYRTGHSPSPPFYRGSSPHRSIPRGRSPSPSYLPMSRRTPSPHRPVTRGQRSPSPPLHRRPISPPSRPQTRGQSAIPPHDLRKKNPVNSPKVPMTNKLRNIKFGSPFQQQTTGSRRQRPSSPTERLPPTKRGRR